jgi:hypothetical protein
VREEKLSERKEWMPADFVFKQLSTLPSTQGEVVFQSNMHILITCPNTANKKLIMKEPFPA